MDLTGKQRRQLRALAAKLEPQAFLGQKGFTENVLAEINDLLEKNELIKVKLSKTAGNRKEVAEKLAQRMSCELVQVNGYNAVIYRKSLTNNVIKLVKAAKSDED
ncbi:YhbY family RNA-binding protein [Lentisphaerota bacterium WC36G]|nr:YhbY family RNA-binding protein [Lentisphaerae bacterium WC36]